VEKKQHLLARSSWMQVLNLKVLLAGALRCDFIGQPRAPLRCRRTNFKTRLLLVIGVCAAVVLVPAVQHSAARQRTNASMAAYVHPYYPQGLELPGVQPLVLPFDKILAVFFTACGMALAAGWYLTGVRCCLG
jgi:hypothetical protein